MPASWWEQLKAMLPDYSGVGQSMPENIGREKIMDPIVNMGVGLATLPQRALGASAEAVTSGIYNPAPAVETGLNLFGGPAAKAGEMVLGAGVKKLPPLVGLLHATGAPYEYSHIRAPAATHDLGIHATIDPGATEGYLYAKHGGNPNKIDMMTGKPFSGGDADPRVKPFLGDFRSAIKYPVDAVKWNEAGNVINGLEDAMRSGFVTPRGLLSDMYNISGSSKMWQDQFIPMMQARGIDSLLYPHGTEMAGGPKFNTFMGFDPAQFTPRYTEEGQKLIAERGVKNPLPSWIGADPNRTSFGVTDPEKYRYPRSIMHPMKEVETLVQDPNPKKNTFKWWEDDSAPLLKQLNKDFMEQSAASTHKSNAHKAMYDLEQLHSKGKVTDEEFVSLYDTIKKSNQIGGADGSIVLADKQASIHNQNLEKQLIKGKITPEEYKQNYKLYSSNNPGTVPSLPHNFLQKQTNDLFKQHKAGEISKDELFAKHKDMWGYAKDQDVITDFTGSSPNHVYKDANTESFHKAYDQLNKDYYNKNWNGTNTKMTQDEYKAIDDAIHAAHGKTKGGVVMPDPPPPNKAELDIIANLYQTGQITVHQMMKANKDLIGGNAGAKSHGNFPSKKPAGLLTAEWLGNLKKDLKAGLITDAEFDASLASVKIPGDEAVKLNTPPKSGGMSPAGHLDKALNDWEDGLISKKEYDKIVARYKK